jgi:hypothetical protein
MLGFTGPPRSVDRARGFARTLPFSLWVLTGFAALAGIRGVPAADDPCASFSWNVAHEHSLFTQQARNIKAGVQPGSAPVIALDRPYELTLASQDQVHFRAEPGKKSKSEGAFGGLARITVPTAGLYRVAVDQPFWVDVVSGDGPIHSLDYQGAPGCTAPHKIVQFLLPAGQQLVVQVSGLPIAHARITVTAAPAAAH